MSQQPTFTIPSEALEFITACVQQNDTDKLYSAFTEAPSEFWKARLVEVLMEIQEKHTLEGVFLDDGKVSSFPEHETVLHLGGHDPRAGYLHIKVVRTSEGWVLESIHICR